MRLTNLLFFIAVSAPACLFELRPTRINVTIDAVILPMDPPIVTVGKDFLVIVKTPSCTANPQDTEISISGLVAEITPYRRLDRSGVLRVMPALADCLSRRIVTLRFASPGLATIRVIGVNQAGERMVVETHIAVHPQ
jgi:hypothetical protein